METVWPPDDCFQYRDRRTWCQMLTRDNEKLKDDGCSVLTQWWWKQQSYFGDEDRSALLNTSIKCGPIVLESGRPLITLHCPADFDGKRKPESPSLS